jgi:hypothetical protein
MYGSAQKLAAELLLAIMKVWKLLCAVSWIATPTLPFAGTSEDAMPRMGPAPVLPDLVVRRWCTQIDPGVRIADIRRVERPANPKNA